MNRVRIALDVMGGDNPSSELIKGGLESLKHVHDIHITLVGDLNEIERELSKHDYDKSRLSARHSSQVIEHDDIPTIAIKSKPLSSMVVGLNMLNSQECSAFVSTGNTGALLTGATMLLGRIEGVHRPALATLVPNGSDMSLLLDCGANIDCKPEYLAQFATMGRIYMEHVMNIAYPRVSLLNIGVEQEKGNALTKQTYKLLESMSELGFIGNVESSEMFEDRADVYVCDGFAGNILIKYAEAFIKYLIKTCKNEIISDNDVPAITNIMKKFDYSIGGAPFLGLNSLVVKAHGSSRAASINTAILQCYYFHKKNIVKIISSSL